eukprot:scaffold118843_cov26-Tisochrysis_lutea.AAC.3
MEVVPEARLQFAGAPIAMPHGQSCVNRCHERTVRMRRAFVGAKCSKWMICTPVYAWWGQNTDGARNTALHLQYPDDVRSGSKCGCGDGMVDDSENSPKEKRGGKGATHESRARAKGGREQLCDKQLGGSKHTHTRGISSRWWWQRIDCDRQRAGQGKLAR